MRMGGLTRLPLSYPVSVLGHSAGKKTLAKNHRSQSGVPGEEGEEIESPKRKFVRAESKETHDHVRVAKSTDQEEVEELSFVPSGISVPQKLLFRCDNQCSEKTSASGSWCRW